MRGSDSRNGPPQATGGTGKTAATAASGPRDVRAERLAASLRANLRRRKQQARNRAAAGAESASPEKAGGQ